MAIKYCRKYGNMFFQDLPDNFEFWGSLVFFLGEGSFGCLFSRLDMTKGRMYHPSI